MKHGVLSLLGAAFLLSAGVANAQTPPEVLKSYRDYRTALEAKDLDAATSHALRAWETAETMLGDHKTTGDLAQNYADVAAAADKKFSKVKDAYLRSIELAAVSGDDAAQLRLMRDVRYAEYSLLSKKERGLRNHLKASAEFAENNGLANSTFSGEIYTMLASLYVSDRRHDMVEDYASKAITAFENADDGIVTYQPLMAQLYLGYSKEGNDDYLPAALAYQEVMENTDGLLPERHPFVMKALGRWMNMRDRIYREGFMEQAEAEGLCKCWPYDQARNESIKPVKRVPPTMPSGAWQSGYSIVEFDLDDKGGVENPRLLESWPEEIWDISSIRAVNKWKYTARTEDETDADRQNIVVTMRYRLADARGNLIE